MQRELALGPAVLGGATRLTRRATCRHRFAGAAMADDGAAPWPITRRSIRTRLTFDFMAPSGVRFEGRLELTLVNTLR